MAVDAQFDKRYAPAEATRGSWVPIDTSTISEYPTGDQEGAARGRYAQLNYIVGSEPGALGTALSGGTPIDVRIVESITTISALEVDLSGATLVQDVETVGSILNPVTINTIQNTVSTFEVRPDTTTYGSVTIAAASVSSISFTPNMDTVEVFNNSQSYPVYIHFNSSDLATVSAQGLPVLPESFYSVDRETATMYIGNADASNSIDVRVIGHYRS